MSLFENNLVKNNFTANKKGLKKEASTKTKNFTTTKSLH